MSNKEAIIACRKQTKKRIYISISLRDIKYKSELQTLVNKKNSIPTEVDNLSNWITV